MLKKIIQFLFHRVVLVAASILVQLAVLLIMLLKFNDYFAYFYAISITVSILVVISVITNKSNPAYKIAWIIPILLVPFFGGMLYLLFGGNKLSNREKRIMAQLEVNFEGIKMVPSHAMEQLDAQDIDAANQSRYIQSCAHCPPFRHTQAEYFALGETNYRRMLEELKKAEHYIFLEYFIIQEGEMWNSILAILEEKAAQGLDVRVMYDDMGCILTLPADYQRTLEQKGIRCCVFGPFLPVLSSRFNNRDHRKICVIDGHTGFTGGFNLADEYINAYPKHGHWKDTGVLLKGEAVWSLTTMFLSMWDYVTGEQENYATYMPSVHQIREVESDGYVQPFTDSPLDDEAVGETVYLNLINKAQRYVYITTPYLIITSEMITALCTAARSGVDVRIITPHVADKWYVHSVTRSYYDTLVLAGVKIYEYTPGFIHAKTFTVDDKYGVVGTINLDFRSLYLHFECAAWLYDCRCIADIREDFLATQAVSGQVTREQCLATRWYVRLVRNILRVFAPMM